MDGILLVDKPSDITSNYLVKKIKNKLKDVKVGHTGTLDFFATGLMIITIGQATKFTQYFQKLDKEYIAVGELGKKTDTYDIKGKVIETKDCFVSNEEIEKAVLSFKGGYLQQPPPFSSKRINGTRAYKLAKKGINPPLKAQFVNIYSIELLEASFPLFKIKVSCSSGTYIRSLVKDIGDKLNCGAYTVSLRRTKVGNFKVEDAVSFDIIEKEKQLEKFIIDLNTALSFFPYIKLDEGFDKRFVYGQRFKVPFEEKGIVRVLSSKESLLGLGKIDERRILHPLRVISNVI